MLRYILTKWRNPPPANPHKIVSHIYALTGTALAYSIGMSNATTRRTTDDLWCEPAGRPCQDGGSSLSGLPVVETADGRLWVRCPACGRWVEVDEESTETE